MAADSSGAPEPGSHCVRCGTRPRPWDSWCGTGGEFPTIKGQNEKRKAKSLPLCIETIRTN